MKTIEQIKAKIEEHEKQIIEALKNTRPNAESLQVLDTGRKALLWVLSDEDFIKADKITVRVDYELLCDEAAEIF